MTLIPINGGIGKQVMFTALLPRIAHNIGPVSIMTAYADVFSSHPDVESVHSPRGPEDVEFWRHWDAVLFREPYAGVYQAQQLHLLHAWADDFGVDRPDVPGPMQVVIPSVYQEAVEQIVAKHSPFVILQTAGGQAPHDFAAGHGYDPTPVRVVRNMDNQTVSASLESVRSAVPDHEILWYGLPNEGPPDGVTVLEAMPYAVWIGLAAACKTFVGIDSSLQHYAAAAGTPGVVLWGGTKPEMIGYDLHQNLRSRIPDTVRVDAAAITAALHAITDEA